MIFGDNLGPATAEFGFNYPLPTVTPAGKVSVAVTVNGTTVPVVILYSGGKQINGVLPSNTPAGTGTLAVTASGQTSATVPIEVVKNNFGTYSVNSAGSGPGIVTYADYGLVTVNKSANPGETLIIWGTGLGPVSGNEAAGALPGDQPGIPAEVYVGGKQASLTYRGRSGCCAGLDQIGFVVPTSVEGCSVPVAVKIGDKVSNFTSMPVAASGRTCTDASTGLTSTDYSNLFSQSTGAIGSVSLSRTTSTSPGFLGLPATTTTTDTGFATFERFSFAPGTSFSSSLFNTVSFGACTVITFSAQSTDPFPGFSYVGLDAGSAINVSGPAGSRTLTTSQTIGKGFYQNSKLGDGTPGNYLDPDDYTITGSGGADVGGFTAKVRIPAALVWTNQSSVGPVNRAAGQLITWSGGDPGSYVSIDGSSFNLVNNTQAVGAAFHCQARVSDASFTIPAIVLLSLPAGAGTSISGITIPTGSLGVGAATTTATFKASGLDLGVVSSSSSTSKSVTYQ